MKLYKQNNPYYYIFILLILISSHSYASASEKTNLAVLDLDMSGGVPQSYQQILTNRLLQELFVTGVFNVMERDKMETILREQAFSLSECVSTECAIQVGRLLAVEEIVAGSVGRIGETHTVSLRKIDIETGKVVDIVTVDCTCSIEEVLSNRLREAARKLAKLDTDNNMSASSLGVGQLTVLSDPKGGLIYVDDRLQENKKTPDEIELSSGQHSIKVTKGDLVGYASAYIVPGMLGRISVQLQLGKGNLSINCVQEGAKIHVDGTYVGETFVNIDTLSAGKHTLKVEKDRFLVHNETFTLKREERISREIDLKPKASLIFYSLHENIDAKINKDDLILNNNDSLFFNPGKYRIEAKLRGYNNYKTSIELKSDENKTLTIHFKPKKRSQAFIRSLLLPGSGQRFAGRKVRGWLVTTFQLASFAYSAYAINDYLDKKDAYNQAYDEYRASATSSEFVRSRQNLISASQAYNDASSIANIAIISSVSIYSINLFDVTFLKGGKIRFGRN